MSLSSLSVELVQEVAGHLGIRPQSALRATCSALCVALDPLVFSTLTLRIGIEKLERDLSRLRALAEGATPFSRYARRVNIAEVTPYEFYWGTDNLKDPKTGEQKELWLVTLREALKPALTTLDGVRIVHWTASRDDPEWLVRDIVDTLATWQLMEFSYVCDIAGALPALGRLSGASLRKLHFFASSQTKLDLEELVTLLHYTPKLVSLSVESRKDLGFDDIWPVLQVNSVYLTELSVNIVSPKLCDYLVSYTGLERVHFRNVDALAVSRETADLFFERVLRRHSASIVELHVFPRYGSRWSFGTHNVGVLSSLVGLEKLGITVDPEYGAAQLQKDITLLLDMVPQLPVLRLLDIETTRDECDRGAWFRESETIEYHREVERMVRGVVSGYRHRGDLELDASMRKRPSVEVYAEHLRGAQRLRMVEADDGDGWVCALFEGTRRVTAEVQDNGD
uniref:F-box domain-containing protein n=1 Tax=Mycena chlorophos TaxID=658473 RepID=A0ABQ0LRL9_MYCCL|nr:predicted protein [Mycena chlorophos]